MDNKKITNSGLRDIQLVELEILKEVDKICCKNNIKYSIGYESILGAVRHQGFIPWDDDIDILMLREEYEKLKEVMNIKLNSKGYFFQDNETNSNYRWGYGKIRKVGTSYIRQGQEHIKCQDGILIYIFPLDGISACKIYQTLQDYWCAFLMKILWSEVGKYNETNKIKRLIYRALSRITKEWVFKQQGNMIFKKDTKDVRYLLFTYTGKHSGKNKRSVYGFDKKWMQDLIEINFEQEKFWTIKEYNKCLKLLYGNYLQLSS